MIRTNSEMTQKKNSWSKPVLTVLSLLAPAALFAQAEGESGGSNTQYYLIAAVVAIALIAVFSSQKAKAIMNKNTFGAEPEKRFSAGWSLLITVLSALVVVLWFEMTFGDGGGSSNIDYIILGAFPYVALVVFLIGSIYRYKFAGFKYSSLSSQFLEGKQLFWASQPFHWGMLVLFFGHLVAFLFPSTLLAWNGSPVRLLILEVSAFAFALSALLGLILFIIRRLRSKTLHFVTNFMDMVVYAVLLLQIVSGLGVAFFDRFGSSWFASSITPYLRSLFALNPEIDAVSGMPWEVKLHIFSAFLIIGLIPFTRFVHFLVAPIDYIWRRYQLVIWNWNRKGIRASENYFPGKEIKNH